MRQAEASEQQRASSFLFTEPRTLPGTYIQSITAPHLSRWPDTSPAAEALCQRLLLPRCDALPPPALEAADGGGGISSLGASSVREHDVQALRTSLGCDREETITLLRCVGGGRVAVGRAGTGRCLPCLSLCAALQGTLSATAAVLCFR